MKLFYIILFFFLFLVFGLFLLWCGGFNFDQRTPDVAFGVAAITLLSAFGSVMLLTYPYEP